MANHNHINGNYRYLLILDGTGTGKGFDSTYNELNCAYGQPMASAGDSKPMNIIQPSVVLYGCKISYENFIKAAGNQVV